MVSLKQNSLSGGIISPQLRGHSDQAKYATGLRDALNFVITREGTAENRAGTLYVAQEVGTVASKLVKFVVSQSLAYVLEFGWNGANAYVRVYQNEQLLTLTGVAAWSNAYAYQGGEFVLYSGNYFWAIQASTNFVPPSNPTYWHQLPGNVMEFDLAAVGSPIAPNVNWLSLMTYAQVNDLMYVASQAFQPFQVTYLGVQTQTGVLGWQVKLFSTSTPIGAPTITGVIPNPSSGWGGPSIPGVITASGGSGAGSNQFYTVASYNASAQQSGVSGTSGPTSGAPTNGSPATVTWASVAGATGYAVYRGTISSQFLVGVVNTAVGTITFVDHGVNPDTAFPAIGAQTGDDLYSYEVTSVDAASGIESLPSAAVSVQSQTPGVGDPIIITWSLVTGAKSYNIYKTVNNASVFGFIGSTNLTSFPDTGIQQDVAIQPPQQIQNPDGTSLFSTPGNFPAVVGAYQQRLLFANTVTLPQTVWGSRVGFLNVFTESTPVAADDALQFTLAGRQIQPVLALVDIGKLIVHTLSGEYIAQGDQSGTLLPTAINIVQQGYAGCQPVQPVSIGTTDLFVQARGSILRDLTFTIQSYSYRGKDLTIFSPDLFAGRSIVSMDWQQVPSSIVWVVLDDGTLLSLTYITEHEIWAWTRHSFRYGAVESVVIIPEAGEDALYLSIRRIINGTTVRYIERMATRDVVVDCDLNVTACFVDSAQVYDGRNTSGDTMTLTGSGWTPTDSLTLTLSNGSNPFHFVSGDVGNAVILQQISTVDTWDDATNVLIPAGTVLDTLTLNIMAYASATVVTVLAGKTVPTWARATPLTTWGKAVHTFTISNLPETNVTGLGDGNVIPLTATDQFGTFTTQANYQVVVAGLRIISRLETLDVENSQGETIANKRKLVTECTPIFYDSRGGLYGQDFQHLYPWRQRGLQSEPWNDPVFLYTGPANIGISGEWSKTGQVCIQQVDPLPLGIAAIVLTGEIGG